MIVFDASAAIALLLNSPPHAAAVRQRLASPAESLHAPHLVDLEVTQVIRRFVLHGDLAPARASAALRDFADLEITRYQHTMFLPRIWQLRHNLTAYDAAYIALAEVLDAPLLTLDTRLRSATGHGAHVELVTQ